MMALNTSGMKTSSIGKPLSGLSLEHGRPLEYPSGSSRPVLRNGRFYCLASDGSLATFDPSRGEWRVLDRPSPVHDGGDVMRCSLVERNGRLTSVFVERESQYVSVFRLDEEESEWEEVTSLGGGGGGQALIVGYPETLLRSSI
ncbi:F-box protein At3g56470-like [Asparagus officinalis]|uniref:F-box protein At3g56470-like n=1 Tax=Asparagus officinalis TaxID=4686 RepID=UPI00098E7DB2|nr:F-box protein At3g56470-like [Asparagus officinalis]